MISLFDQGRAPACPQPFNMAAHVLTHAQAPGDKVALTVVRADGHEDWTYARLERAVRATGTGLLAAGLAPGQIVLLRLGNTVEFPIAYLGAVAAGLVPVATSSQLTAVEITRIIADLAPSAILHDPDVACPDHPARIAKAALQGMRSLPPCDWHMGDAGRMGYIVYTSGTSASPRAVAHAHRAVWARRMMQGAWCDLRAGDRLCHAGAFNWTYTLGTGMLDPWSVGATAIIPAPDTGIQTLPALLHDHGVTIFAATPGVYRKLLQATPRLDAPALRHGLSAGEKLSPPVQKAWTRATGKALYEAYGLSECSTFISSGPARPADDGALGGPQPGRRVAIVDDAGPVAIGKTGIIAIDRHDPGLMLGYVNAPGETAARMQGPWFLTGDLGRMAGDGQITFLGRKDDMMNPGGHRVSPFEVEKVLAHFPGLTEVGVAEVEVKPGVRIIAAFYTAPMPLDEADLHAYVDTNLARYKHPRAYIRLNALPTGANGKLRRRSLPAYFKADTHERTID